MSADSCEALTVPHPQTSQQEPRYCLHCAGQFPVDQLRVITFEHNPYEQDEDGDMNHICLKCLAKEDREFEEDDDDRDDYSPVAPGHDEDGCPTV